jgi:hypothetical protein
VGRRSALRTTQVGGFRVSGRHWLAQASKTQADLLGRTSEISIPGHDDGFLTAELERGSEVNRVVTAKSEIFGELAGATGEVRIDPDRDQICLQLLKGRQSLCVLVLPQAVLAPPGRQSRASLRVGEDAGRRRMGAGPELG